VTDWQLLWQAGDMPAHDATSRCAFPDLHDCFPHRADALFEVVDALLAVVPRPRLGLRAAHRRMWVIEVCSSFVTVSSQYNKN
jgi:hypothetical protein